MYGRWGRMAEARQAIKKMQQSNRGYRIDLAQPLLSIHAAMGDNDQVFALLQEAISQHNDVGMLLPLKVDPIFDPIRSDPRYQQILRQIHFN